MEQQTATSERPPLKIPSTVKHLIETLIFAASEPLTIRQIKAIYEQPANEGEERHLEQSAIQQAIGELNEEYQKAGRGYRIIAIAGGYQFATMKEYAEWIGRLSREQARRKLSQSSLESLAIVAYKQPVSKPEIESIRGVNCDYVLKTLLEKDLVTIVGRAETVGRPLLYGTTREFLRHFGLNEVTDLPRPREIEEILGESQFETERRMLEAAAGAEQMRKEEEDFKSRLPHIPKKKPELDEEVQIVPKSRQRKITVRKDDPGVEAPESSEQSKETPPTTVEDRTPSVETPTVESGKPDAAVDEPIAAEPTSEIPQEKDEPDAVPLIVPPVRPKERQAPLSLDDLEDLQRHDRDEAVHEEPASEIPGRAEPPADVDLPLGTSDDVRRPPSVAPETPDEIPQEPEMTQPRRFRWTSWKEKIQTFIKKLFA